MAIMENPGALAGATGAVSNDQRITLEPYHRHPAAATLMRRYGLTLPTAAAVAGLAWGGV